MASPRVTVEVKLTEIPEALIAMRTELAKAIRDVADKESPMVRTRLRDIASAFEAGITPEKWADGV